MGLRKHTSVAFEDLQHLAALQVPYIYFWVLTTTHYVQTLSSTEATEQAIRPVGMTNVRFHATWFLIVPESDRRVLGCWQDEFWIRREFDVWAENAKSVRRKVMTKSIHHIGLSSSTRVFRHWPDSASQIRLDVFREVSHRSHMNAYISPSIAQDTMSVPSWLKLTAVTGSEWAGRTFSDFPGGVRLTFYAWNQFDGPLATSQTRTVSS